MSWRYRVDVDVPARTAMDRLLRPDRWMSFYSMYCGVEHADDHWPARGSTMRLLLGLGPLRFRLHQKVVDRDDDRRVFLEEHALGGLWCDHPALSFLSDGDRTRIVLMVKPTSRWMLARPFVWLTSLAFAATMPIVCRRIRAMVERE